MMKERGVSRIKPQHMGIVPFHIDPACYHLPSCVCGFQLSSTAGEGGETLSRFGSVNQISINELSFAPRVVLPSSALSCVILALQQLGLLLQHAMRVPSFQTLGWPARSRVRDDAQALLPHLRGDVLTHRPLSWPCSFVSVALLYWSRYILCGFMHLFSLLPCGSPGACTMSLQMHHVCTHAPLRTALILPNNTRCEMRGRHRIPASQHTSQTRPEAWALDLVVACTRHGLSRSDDSQQASSQRASSQSNQASSHYRGVSRRQHTGLNASHSLIPSY
ncbi:hypothetical protein B0J13DRAFT_177410 [Dactylonectria estremocensis]|uniref:Uncharacterized protein n=1 Tax=Dactylonectria estremocensis TaxID=1079267 RepID=A0A9P9JEY8_9HYPO|nr:hypothetical protein B0J13DRAFT_177410 [Dactylonectria estremocensis]